MVRTFFIRLSWNLPPERAQEVYSSHLTAVGILLWEIRGWKDTLGFEGQEKSFASHLPGSPLWAERRPALSSLHNWQLLFWVQSVQCSHLFNVKWPMKVQGGVQCLIYITSNTSGWTYLLIKASWAYKGRCYYIPGPLGPWTSKLRAPWCTSKQLSTLPGSSFLSWLWKCLQSLIF